MNRKIGLGDRFSDGFREYMVASVDTNEVIVVSLSSGGRLSNRAIKVQNHHDISKEEWNLLVDGLNLTFVSKGYWRGV